MNKTRSENARMAGFKRLEVAFIVILLSLVGLLAITKYLDFSVTVKEAMESGVIEGIRQGISSYAIESRDSGRNPIYPLVLDEASAGEATPSNPFFSNVLKEGIAVTGWAKAGPTEYRAPSGAALGYDPRTGQFMISEDVKREGSK